MKDSGHGGAAAATLVQPAASLLERAVESTLSGISISDATRPGRPLIFVNPAFTAMTGYSAEEVLGHSCNFLQGPGTDRDTLEALRSALADGRAIDVTLRNYRKDGSEFWNALRIAPVHAPDGVLTHFIGLQSDVTARLVAEEELRHLNLVLEERVVERTFDLASALAAVRESHEEALQVVGLALEYRDVETSGHTDRVLRLAVALGRAIGLDDDALEALRWGSYLHDVGKMAVPDEILLKPGRLTAAEFRVIQRHVEIGEHMLGRLSFMPRRALEVVRHHHERWDGNGYPDGLTGTDIPILARIFSLADVYDALSSERPYKAAWSQSAVLGEIERQAGTQFDPTLARAFRNLMQVTAPVEGNRGTSIVALGR